jgi:hypothetical protein
MRGPQRCRDWLFVAALAMFLGFWIAALTGGIPSPPPSQKQSQTASDNSTDQNGPLTDFWNWITKDSIGFFTFVLAIVASSQGALIWRQGNLARKEFIATHRPRIFVQSVSIVDSATPTAFFEIVNGGESDAILIEWSGVLYSQDIDKLFRPSFGPIKRPTVKRCVLTPGRWETIDYSTGEIISTWKDFSYKLGFGSEMGKFFLVGKIVYEGLDNIRRNTGFCRMYDRGTRMWRPVEKSEYEYTY